MGTVPRLGGIFGLILQWNIRRICRGRRGGGAGNVGTVPRLGGVIGLILQWNIHSRCI